MQIQNQRPSLLQRQIQILSLIVISQLSHFGVTCLMNEFYLSFIKFEEKRFKFMYNTTFSFLVWSMPRSI
jgi:hypothetical protein